MKKNLKILVVDDDENLCENMKDVLSNKNYRVSTASNSNEAIKMVRENKFEIMLLDMKLPPLNGFETYMAIKKIRPELTVIIITGYSGEMNNMIADTLKKSAYNCIEKPINMNRLFSLLELIKEQKANGRIKKQ